MTHPLTTTLTVTITTRKNGNHYADQHDLARHGNRWILKALEDRDDIEEVIVTAQPPADQTTDRAAILTEAADAVAKEREATDVNVAVYPRWDGRQKLALSAAERLLRRLAAEAPTTTKPDTETLAAMFEGFGRLLATSSRDWGQYAPDAWLYAVILGWDCEQTEHDETCTHGAMEEMQQRHGWSDEAVAKARRYRAAVRALTKPADGTRTADLLAGSATEYRVPVPEGGGTDLIVRRQGVAFGAGWSVAVPGWGGGRAWTAEGWQDSISALSVDRLFCWPDAETAVAEARRALAAGARQDGAS